MVGPIQVSRCQKSEGRRLAVGIFDKKPKGYLCTFDTDCQGNLKCIHGGGKNDPLFSYCMDCAKEQC